MYCSLHGVELQSNRGTNPDDNKDYGRPLEKRHAYIIQELGDTELGKLVMN
jgi:hypothetical protein